MVTPRWLRQHRRARARTLAADVADELLRQNIPGRELTLEEIIRAQRVTPFNREEHERRRSLLTSDDWAELRAALAEARKR